MFRRIMSTVLIFIALLAITGGVVYWVYDGYMYYRTDDAQVTGEILNISAPASGTLSALNVTVGQTVKAHQVIGTITVPPTSAPGVAAANGPSTINLTSPISGTVVQVPAIQGQAVAAGLQLASIANLNPLTVTAYVDEGSINKISLGQAVDISVDAYSGTSFSGHVEQIVQATAGEFSLLPNQDPTSGNFTKVGQRIPVMITIDNKEGKDLMPGMSAEVVIHLH